MQSLGIRDAQDAVVIGPNCSYIALITLRYTDRKSPKRTLGPQSALKLTLSLSSVLGLFGGSAPLPPYPALPPLFFRGDS